MAISQIENQNLGKFLQIVFSDGVRNQISEDFRDWEYIARKRAGDPNGRELRFFFQKNFGPAAIQWSGINPAGSFPSSQQITVQENVALYKEINATIELEYNLWERARMSPDKYAEPLAIEIQSKATASKRRLSSDLYGDGTGVLGVMETPSVVSGELKAVLSSANTARGHVGAFEFGDKINFYSTDGVTKQAPTLSSGTFDHFTVEEKNRDGNYVVLKARDSSGTALTVTAVNALSTGDLAYRAGQPTRADLSGSVTDDYNTLTEVMAGLESLSANDSRIIHGITMRGATAGSRFDCSAAALDSSHFQRALSQTKTVVGGGKYKFPMALMAPEALDALIESRETDRRFMSVQDNKRGVSSFVYVHGEDNVEMQVSEFCPKKRIYILPEAKASKEKVLELWGSDFRPVRPAGQGSEFYLKPASGGGHDRFIRSYLMGIFALVAKHPAAITVLHNFTV